MWFKPNLPTWERILRAVVGVLLFIGALTVPMPAWAMWMFAVAGITLLLTAMIAFCPLCALAGRRLAD
jgi:hypothetical protein